MNISNILIIAEKNDRQKKTYKYEEKISRGENVKRLLDNKYGYLVTLNTLLEAVERKSELHNYDCILIINQDIVNTEDLLNFVKTDCPETTVMIIKIVEPGECYGYQEDTISRLTITEPIENSIVSLIEKIDELIKMNKPGS